MPQTCPRPSEVTRTNASPPSNVHGGIPLFALAHDSLLVKAIVDSLSSDPLVGALRCMLIGEGWRDSRVAQALHQLGECDARRRGQCGSRVAKVVEAEVGSACWLSRARGTSRRSQGHLQITQASRHAAAWRPVQRNRIPRALARSVRDETVLSLLVGEGRCMAFLGAQVTQTQGDDMTAQTSTRTHKTSTTGQTGPRPRWLTYPEAAELSTLSVRSLKRLTAAGTLRCYAVGGKVLRLKASDVEALIVPADQCRNW